MPVSEATAATGTVSLRQYQGAVASETGIVGSRLNLFNAVTGGQLACRRARRIRFLGRHAQDYFRAPATHGVLSDNGSPFENLKGANNGEKVLVR